MHACCTVGRKVCLRLHLLVGVWYNVNRPYAVQYYSVVVSRNHKIKIALDAGMAVTKIAICSSAAITTNCTCTVHYKIASAVTKSRNHEIKMALDVEWPLRKSRSARVLPLRNLHGPSVTKLYRPSFMRLPLQQPIHMRCTGARSPTQFPGAAEHKKYPRTARDETT